MDSHKGPLAVVAHALHRHFLWLLLIAYAVAALLPEPGLWLRGLNCGEVGLFGETVQLSLPVALLAFLLFSTGLTVQSGRMTSLVRRPAILAVGLAANLVVPLGFLFALGVLLRLWPSPDEAQQLLIGLGLVAAMPIAGSSAAWSQKTEGDTALSLGLVVCSTLFSPLTTPLALHTVGWLLDGTYADLLHHLAYNGAGMFLLLCVALPSMLGLVGHKLVGEPRVRPWKPPLQLANSLVLLTLVYSNAAVSLPRVFTHAGWSFLVGMLVVVMTLCMVCFTAGWWLAAALRADRPRQAALMFGLGMNNNGTGLVLAASALGGHPEVMLPVIFYNLAQHLVAAVAVQVTGKPDAQTVRMVPVLATTEVHPAHATLAAPHRRQTRPAA